MFPKGERAHPTTKPSSQQGSDVPRRGTSPSHNKTFRSTRKRCFPKGNKLEPTLRQACFMVCCSFRPLEVRRHLVNALPKGAVNLVPLRTSTSGSVSYNAAYTHPAPVRLPLSSSQSTCEEVTSSYHNMPGSYQDNGYEDSQISALLPIYYQ